MSSPLIELVKVQFKEYWREPEVLFWTLGFPIAIAWILGLLYTSPAQKQYKVALVNPDNIITEYKEGHYPIYPSDNSIGTKATTSTALPSGELVELISMDLEEAFEAQKKGAVQLVVLITRKKTEFHFDPGNESAKIAWLSLVRDDNLKNSTIVEAKAKGTRYIDYLIPGLIAFGIMNSTLWGVGWSLIEFRIKKFLRRMVASPMKKPDFILSVFITRLALSIVEISFLYLFARITFNVTFEGSIAGIVILSLSAHAMFGGLSVLMASRTANTRVANGLINAITLPMFLVSGVFFSYHNFPEWLVKWLQYMPLTVIADLSRELFNGAGTEIVLFPAFVLTLVGGLLFALGLKLYRWY